MKEHLGERWLIILLGTAAIGLGIGFAGAVFGLEIINEVQHQLVERSVDATMGTYLTATVRAMATGTPTP